MVVRAIRQFKVLQDAALQLVDMGQAFLAQGVQIAAGVPLMCDEGADFQSFRLGLFGFDKLYDPAPVLRRLEESLDVIDGAKAPL